MYREIIFTGPLCRDPLRCGRIRQRKNRSLPSLLFKGLGPRLLQLPGSLWCAFSCLPVRPPPRSPQVSRTAVQSSRQGESNHKTSIVLTGLHLDVLQLISTSLIEPYERQSHRGQGQSLRSNFASCVVRSGTNTSYHVTAS